MPQVFQVLWCYQCLVFQVLQRKKTFKFECKLCGEKQSIKRNYGLGTAKECRHHVQKLNKKRGEQDNEKLKNISYNSSSSDEEVENKKDKKPFFINFKPNKSKWSNFVEESEDTPEPVANETMYLNNTEVVLELPKKRKGKFKAPITSAQRTAFEANVTNNFQSKETLKISQNYNDTIPTCGERNARQPVSTINMGGYVREPGKQTVLHDNVTECHSEHMKKDSKKFVPPPINKDSKWAQFVQPGTSSSDIVPHPQELFALCNDDDLDNVLFMY